MAKMTEEQMNKLENLINKHDDIIDMLNNKLDLWKTQNYNKSDRITKSLKINKFIDEKVTEKMSKYRFNYSDMINVILKKGLEYID